MLDAWDLTELYKNVCACLWDIDKERDRPNDNLEYFFCKIGSSNQKIGRNQYAYIIFRIAPYAVLNKSQLKFFSSKHI